ncbi:hypothetical protein HK100_002796 [Physocladia obscura]|uniref:EIF2B subunit epsilon/gamma LbH domain-containing protein n=1 Tax=Physocladia obscura TaxID=109957 RepID=A0AAD5SXN5_9FUNG|nr:hypothetical protein HK100_002796 [Physocladia obscura]
MIVCQEDSHKKISSYIHNILNVSERYPNTKVEVVKVKGNGSADALRLVANRIKLLDVFRIQSPTFTALFHEPLKPDNDSGSGSGSGGGNSLQKNSNKDDDLTEYVAIDHSTCRLLFAVGSDEVDDELPVRMSILDKFAVVNIHTKLRDAHLYVFKHWVIDYVARSKIQSIKDELIPMLTHFQYSEKVLKREGVDKFLTQPSNFDDFYNARNESSTGGGFVNSHPSASINAYYANLSHHQNSITPASASSSAILLENEDVDQESTDFHKSIICTALVAREGLCFRVNSVPTYLEGSRALIKTISPEDLVPRSVERQKGCQVGDSLIGDSTRIGEKTGIKKSVIGKHCVIGKNVKIINSVLMDHCVIGDKVILEGTVVCDNSKVFEQCTLKDCQVGPNLTIEKEVNGKGETYID